MNNSVPPYLVGGTGMNGGAMMATRMVIRLQPDDGELRPALRRRFAITAGLRPRGWRGSCRRSPASRPPRIPEDRPGRARLLGRSPLSQAYWLVGPWRRPPRRPVAR